MPATLSWPKLPRVRLGIVPVKEIAKVPARGRVSLIAEYHVETVVKVAVITLAEAVAKVLA